MNPFDLDTLKTKILAEMEWRKISPHVADMAEYAEMVNDAPGSRDNTEYLFNILRDAGRIDMMGAELEESLLEGNLPMNSVKALFGMVLSPGRNAPTSVDFRILEYKMEEYGDAWKKFHEAPAPRPGQASEMEAAWEEARWKLRDDGLELILSALDVFAVRRGRIRVLEGAETGPGWEGAWGEFEPKADRFLNQICAPEHARLFFFLSDDVLRLTADFTAMPEGRFMEFIREITACRKTYVEENHYRHVFSREEARETRREIMEAFGDTSPTKRVRLYESALGEKAIRKFLVRTCAALGMEDPAFDGPWIIVTTAESGSAPDISVLRTGKGEYGVHMLPPRIRSGWGIPMDRIEPLLGGDHPEFMGALFCSLKEYPNGAVLVRFDNYMERERFEKLLTELPRNTRNIARLPIHEVYAEDRRDAFLHEAAMHAAGVEKKSKGRKTRESEFRKEIEFLENMRAAAAVIMSVIGVARAHRLGILFRLKHIAPPQYLGVPPPTENIIFIPETFDEGKWDRIHEFTPIMPSDEKYDAVTELVEYIEADDKPYSYILAFMDEKQKVIEISEQPESFDSVEGVEHPAPRGTETALLVLGPRETMDIALRGGDPEKTTRGSDGESHVFWVIYGPKSAHSEER